MSINKANQHCGWDSLIICDAQNSLGVHRLLMAGSQVPGLRSRGGEAGVGGGRRVE